MARTAIVQTQNLLTFSNTFNDASWILSTATLTAAQGANPITGANDVWKLTEANSTNQMRFYHGTTNIIATNGTLTCSIYAKAGTRNWAYLSISDGPRAWFNLSTGAIGTVSQNSGTVTSTIAPVPNRAGWYLISIILTNSTLANSSGANCSYGLTTGDGVVNDVGDGTGTMFFYQASAALSNWTGPYTTPTGSSQLNANGALRNYIPQIQNLLLYSEDLTQANWSKVNVTASATGVTDSNDGGAVQHYIFQSTPTGTPAKVGQFVTFSVSAKAGTLHWIALDVQSAVVGYFDLTNGVLGNVTAGYQCSIVPDPIAGPGYYRCSVTYPNTVTPDSYVIALSTANGSITYQGNGTGTVSLTRMQLTVANWVSPYIKTTTAAFNIGNIRNIVPQTQNLVTYSEQFDNVVWGLANATITANTTDTLDPLGGNTADILIENTTSGQHRVGVTPSPIVPAGNTCTISADMKAGTRTWCALYSNSGGVGLAYFDLQNGVVGSVALGTSTMKSLGNGWYRCSVTYIATTVQTIVIAAASGDGGINYVGVNGAKAIYIWGAQFVQANWAGPYQQTVASAVNTGNIRNTINPYTTNLLVDGNMEASGVTAWTAVSSAVLTKRSDTPPVGTQYLRVGFGGSGINYATQNSALGVKQVYTVTGYCRSDGTSVPNFANNGNFTVVGTNSQAWQYFQFSFMSDGVSQYGPGSQATANGGYTDWDQITITPGLRKTP